MSPSNETLVELLRGRVLRGLRAGTLEPGDRLPSARETASEFAVEHRLVLAAFRALADEGLIEVRERGGVYVARGHASQHGEPAVPLAWMIDTFAEAYAREIAAPDLAGHLQRALETLRLRAVVISSTEDQVSGLARELRDDFGLLAEGITTSALADEAQVHPALKRADLLLTTPAHAALVESLAASLGKPSIVVEQRPDLVAGEWALLLRQPLWAVVATQDFADMLKRFFANVRGIENLNVLVHGRDDLSVIPEGAPTYVTQRVREALAVTATKGRVLPPARTIATGSARQIFEFIVHANMRAREVVGPPVQRDGAARRA